MRSELLQSFYRTRMTSYPLKHCSYPGCGKLFRNSGLFCDKHRVIADKNREERKRINDKKRDSSGKRGYSSAWRRAREGFLAHHPFCVVCEAEGFPRLAVVVDHIVPHKGDKNLFWDKSNWQPLCKHHHDLKTARENGGFGNAV